MLDIAGKIEIVKAEFDELRSHKPSLITNKEVSEQYIDELNTKWV